jgi:hypothetical protein
MYPPYELLQKAESLEEWPDSILWAQECYECHMPGDCYLCSSE